MNRFLSNPWTKRVAFVLSLIPLGYLVWRGVQGRLTGNPIEYITHFTGDWTIRYLLITLAITPLRSIFNRPALTRFRRMFGLFAFFYGSLHFTVWYGLDKSFSLSEMWFDIQKRPYITMGMLGFAAMVPLAITSTAGWVRRMGFKKWQRLHRLIYLTGIAGVIHYFWLVKSDIRMPLLYAVILGVLLAYRVYLWTSKPKPGAKRQQQAAVQTP